MEKSPIIKLNKVDRHHGIILNSINEVATALDVFVKSKGGFETQKWHVENVDVKGLQVTAELASLFSLQKNRQATLTKSIVDTFMSKLESEGKADFSGDHPESGTPFFKMAMCGICVGNKYILQLAGAGVGYLPEEKLAEQLHKPRALESCTLEAIFSVQQNNWYKIEVCSALNPLCSLLDEWEVEKLQRDCSRLVENDSIYFKIKHKKKIYCGSIRLENVWQSRVVDSSIEGIAAYKEQKYDLEKKKLEDVIIITPPKLIVQLYHSKKIVQTKLGRSYSNEVMQIDPMPKISDAKRLQDAADAIYTAYLNK